VSPTLLDRTRSGWLNLEPVHRHAFGVPQMCSMRARYRGLGRWSGAVSVLKDPERQTLGPNRKCPGSNLSTRPGRRRRGTSDWVLASGRIYPAVPSKCQQRALHVNLARFGPLPSPSRLIGPIIIAKNRNPPRVVRKIESGQGRIGPGDTLHPDGPSWTCAVSRTLLSFA
jgi:hypothetical protein